MQSSEKELAPTQRGEPIVRDIHEWRELGVLGCARMGLAFGLFQGLIGACLIMIVPLISMHMPELYSILFQVVHFWFGWGPLWFFFAPALGAVVGLLEGTGLAYLYNLVSRRWGGITMTCIIEVLDTSLDASIRSSRGDFHQKHPARDTGLPDSSSVP